MASPQTACTQRLRVMSVFQPPGKPVFPDRNPAKQEQSFSSLHGFLYRRTECWPLFSNTRMGDKTDSRIYELSTSCALEALLLFGACYHTGSSQHSGNGYECHSLVSSREIEAQRGKRLAQDHRTGK